MKLVQGVLRSLAVGMSPSCLGLPIARTLATSSASALDVEGSASSFESVEDFEKKMFGDGEESSQSSNSFFQKLDRAEKSPYRSGLVPRFNGPSTSGLGPRFNGPNRSGFMDVVNDGFSLTDGMDGKLKEAATYFEYDMDTVDKDDYKYRPDVKFWPGNTYDVKDLDLRTPGVRKPAKRYEFEVTTEEVLQKADFRNVRFLANFITEAGIIVKRNKSKISAKAQRKIAREIKTARAFGLMPFTTMGTKHFAFGKTMEDLDEDYEYETYDHNFVDVDAS